MPDYEKFSLGKFFGSFFQFIPWVKDIRTILGILIISAVIFSGYKAINHFFPGPAAQQQHTEICVQPGGTLNLNQNQKNEAKKRAWWLPHIFGEIYGFQETDRSGVGARAGGRLEW